MGLRLRSFRRTRPPSVPRGKRVYAIGDIHGQRDLLARLMSMIRRDNEERRVAETYLIFIGDLIDRGANSAEVIRVLMDASESRKAIPLLGNHESTLLAVYDGDHEAASAWFRYFGGAATLLSFGVNLNTIDPDDPAAIIAAVQYALPVDVITWLKGLPLYYTIGDYYFVHAGVAPGVSLSKQTGEDQLWIRDEFLSSDEDHGAVIVHGHTIEAQGPAIRPNRIGLDTGAYETGRLSAIGIEGTELWPISVHDPSMIT
jgi:serine/threonine protein phosphatase 1